MWSKEGWGFPMVANVLSRDVYMRVRHAIRCYDTDESVDVTSKKVWVNCEKISQNIALALSAF